MEEHNVFFTGVVALHRVGASEGDSLSMAVRTVHRDGDHDSYGYEIEEVLASAFANSSKAEAVIDLYTVLQSKAEREAFVLALAAERFGHG